MARGAAEPTQERKVMIKEQLAKLTALIDLRIPDTPCNGLDNDLPMQPAIDNTITHELAKETYALLNAIKGPSLSVFNFGEQVMHVSALRALFGLGVFSALPQDRKAMTATALAEKLGCDEELLIRLMRICTIWGPFKEVETKTYSHTQFSLAYMDPQVTNQFQALIDEFLPACLQLHRFLEINSGKPPVDATNCPYTLAHQTGGKDMWEHLARFPKRSQALNSAMYAISSAHPWPVALYPFRKALLQLPPTSSNPPLVVDIGGGQGQAISAIRQMCGDINGRFILEDRPEVLAGIPHTLHGIEKIECDLFKPQPVKGAAIYFLRHVIHDWAEDACVRILQNIASAITDKSTQRVVISEMVLPEKGVTAECATQDLVTLCTTGAERSRKQWERLISAAGFRVENIYSTEAACEAAIECYLE